MHLTGDPLQSLGDLRGAVRGGELSLTWKGLTSLPPEIGQLTSLVTLRLEGNQLTGLPPEIGELTNLGALSLSGNRLTELPPEIGNLSLAARLWLDGNQLSALPSQIGQLTNLQVLSLDGNQLTALPPEIGRLTNLQVLSLNGNKLTTLPPEIGYLTNLQKLSLDGNQLTALPPEIGRLTSLVDLHLDSNQLTKLPPQIGRLNNLRSFSVDHNRLTFLPQEIGRLTNLLELKLGGNQLTGLPREISAIVEKSLRLDLQDNPLAEPYPELMTRGTHAVLAYLRSLKDAVAQYEAKVVIVGDGEVGKTSLVAALRHEDFVKGRSATHGIKIRELALPHPEFDVHITLRTWDFGGQPVYRVTHQLFFSQRALYILVWDARRGQERNDVDGWLSRIRLRVGSDARTLLVATYCGECSPKLNYPHLKNVYPYMLAGHHEIDNFTGLGISPLRDAIAEQAAGLPHMGQLISPRWVAARREIFSLAETEPQISYDQFEGICKRNGVLGDEIITLAQLLHDLGQIIHFGDDEGLRDLVVLNPEWLTEAISYVLEDEVTEQEHGELDHARLREIWQDRPDGTVYPARYHPYFLRLMEKFDISYRLADDEHRSLVAQLVPSERPELPWNAMTAPATGERVLSLICRLKEPAPGLIAWLTVRHHNASMGKHWRSGVFLRHPNPAYRSTALLELTKEQELTIEVRAPTPDLFMHVLQDTAEDLIARRWPGLKYELYIPCPNRDADGGKCVGEFRLEGLLNYRERGGATMTCLECVSDHDVSELLTGFAQPVEPLQPELERLEHQIAEVADSAERLEKVAAETADSIRRVLGVVGSEVNDCPRLFVITSVQPSGARRLLFYQKRYHLTLWCEHPDHWHPWPGASYEMDEPKKWLVRLGPYATLVVKVLKTVIPMAGAIADLSLNEEQFKRTYEQIEIMENLLEELPEQDFHDRLEVRVREGPSELTKAEGQALRAFRVWLFERDRLQRFGGLRRVQAPSGELLWVCPLHYVEYDPGLPTILSEQAYLHNGGGKIADTDPPDGGVV
jgi:internalin A